MTIEVISDSEEYGPLVRNFVQSNFPQVQMTAGDKLEVLTKLLVGTLQWRLGPTPTPESLVLMRNIIRDSLNRNCSIPVLIPYGPKKPGDMMNGVDIAELSVLKALGCLQDCVKKIFSPGLGITFRMEDATGILLEGEKHFSSMDLFTTGFKLLVEILGMDAFIRVQNEMDMFPLVRFREQVEKLHPVIHQYLLSTTGEEATLIGPAGYSMLSIGWKGVINLEMRSFYLGKYEKIYGGERGHDYLSMVAKYFACALARVHLTERKSAIQVNFMNPIPGSRGTPGTKLFRRYLQKGNHVIPWRAKGFLWVTEKDGEEEVLPAATDWSCPPSELAVHHLWLTNGEKSVKVQADIFVD